MWLKTQGNSGGSGEKTADAQGVQSISIQNGTTKTYTASGKIKSILLWNPTYPQRVAVWTLDNTVKGSDDSPVINWVNDNQFNVSVLSSAYAYNCYVVY